MWGCSRGRETQRGRKLRRPREGTRIRLSEPSQSEHLVNGVRSQMAKLTNEARKIQPSDFGRQAPCGVTVGAGLPMRRDGLGRSSHNSEEWGWRCVSRHAHASGCGARRIKKYPGMGGVICLYGVSFFFRDVA